jgi:hypothetical protein
MLVAVCLVRDEVWAPLVADIRSRLKGQLDASRRPRHLMLRSTLLAKGSNGKVHRTALRTSVAVDELVAL